MESYDVLKRLGLSEEEEQASRKRFPEATGLLTVARVLDGGPACPFRKNIIKREDTDDTFYATGLEPSDILLTCNGKYVIDFISLWDIIDNSINEDITLEIVRGTVLYKVIVTVQDLHSITPNRFLDYGGAIIQDLSYQLARTNSECLGKGVFCAASGFMLWSNWNRGFLIIEVDGKPTPNLDAFIAVVCHLPDYKRVPFKSRTLGSTTDSIFMVDIDWHFHAASIFTRNDKEGSWDREDLEPPDSTQERGLITPTPISTPIPGAQTPIPIDSVTSHSDDETASKDEDLEENQEIATTDLQSSFVNVICYLPMSIYGDVSNSCYMGVGLIVSLDPIPLVLFDREAVPSDMIDIRLTISYKNVPGRVVYLGHFALLTFDRHLLPPSCVISVPEWDDKPLRVREEVRIFGLTSDQLLRTAETTISSICPARSYPGDPPRYRPVNLETGIITDGTSRWGTALTRKEAYKKLKKGQRIKVAAYMLSDFETLDLQTYVFPIVQKINEERLQSYSPDVWNLGYEFSDLPLSMVASLGLGDERFAQFVEGAKMIRGVPRPLEIRSRLQPPTENMTEEEEEKHLKITDILLEISKLLACYKLQDCILVQSFLLENHHTKTREDGEFISRVSQLAHIDFANSKTLDVVVLRNRQEVHLQVKPVKGWPTMHDTIVQVWGAIGNKEKSP